jgi:hypothetical protein
MFAIASVLLLALAMPATTDAVRTTGARARHATSVLELFERTWIAKAADNICGLRDVAQVSNPAAVDFKACLDVTPEMKKAREEKIDLTTPEGIKLTNEAVNRVTEACETIRVANGYCSVWKAIKHKDGRAAPDITQLVKALY